MDAWDEFDDGDEFDEFDGEENPLERRRRVAFAIASVIFAVVAIVPAIAFRIADPGDFRAGCWIHEPPHQLSDCLPSSWRP